MWRGKRGQGAACEHPILCPPYPAALGLQDSRQPSPVCRRPFHFLQSREAPSSQGPSSPGSCFSRAMGNGGGQGKGRFSGLVGPRTPLPWKGKLAALEPSCLSSLVLAAVQGPSVAQKLQVREGCYAARSRLPSTGGKGTVALPRATGKEPIQPGGHLPRMIGQVPLLITGVPGHKLTGLSPGIGDMPGSESQEAPALYYSAARAPRATTVAENTGAMPSQPHPTLPQPCLLSADGRSQKRGVLSLLAHQYPPWAHSWGDIWDRRV